MNSDTPKTDAVAFFTGCDGRERHPCGDYVESDFARKLEREKSDAERRQLGLAYDVQYLRGQIQRAIDYAGGRESEWGERAEGAFAILYAALAVPASGACEDTHRLNSGTILLTVHGESVHYVAQDLRAAIDAGIAANVRDQRRPALDSSPT